jgi:hypothetical protein
VSSPNGAREMLLLITQRIRQAQMLEAKSDSLRLQQAIPLTEPEIAAIDEASLLMTSSTSL